MIQRIQTIYLLLAFLLNGLTAIAPLWRFTEGEQAERIQGFQYLLQGNDAFTVFIDTPEILRTTFFFEHADLMTLIGHITLISGVLLACLLTFINIFRYKNRKGQIRMGRFVIFLVWMELVALAWLIFQPHVYLSEAAQHAFDYGSIFPLLTLLFLWLANRGIRRDEKLVRSVDRIR
jgi:heme A synthase